MRILLVHNIYRYAGGEETYFGNLTKLLKRHGHAVRLYTKDTKSIRFADKIRIAGALFWNNQTMDDIDGIHRSFHPDVAIVQNVFPLIGATVYHALKKHRIPIIQHVTNYRLVCPKTHLYRDGRLCELCVKKKLPFPAILYGCYNSSRLSSLFFALSQYYHQYVKKSYSLIDSFVFPSGFTRDYLVRHNAVPATKAKVVPTFAFPVRSGSGRDRHPSSYLYAGRLSEEKGIMHIIRLFDSPLLRHVRLIILGDGPLKRRVIASSRIQKNIRYAGNVPRNRVMDYLRRSMALIMPSQWYDVLPNIALEAFSLGIPVVAPDFGTFASLIRNGKNGYKYSSQGELIQILLDLSSGRTKIRGNIIRLAAKDYLNPARHYQLLMKTARDIISNR